MNAYVSMRECVRMRVCEGSGIIIEVCIEYIVLERALNCAVNLKSKAYGD